MNSANSDSDNKGKAHHDNKAGIYLERGTVHESGRKSQNRALSDLQPGSAKI